VGGLFLIKFDKQFTDYMTFQRTEDGFAHIYFYGTYSGELTGCPFIRITDEITGNICKETDLPVSSVWKIDAILAAGVYRIECGELLETTGRDKRYLGRGHQLRHITVGEIFVIAGQSNAVGYGVQNEADEKDTPRNGITMRNDEGWQLASHPIGQMKGNIACSDFFNSAHSPWLRFASYFLDEHIPVGLVPAAMNGSAIYQWQKGEPLYEYLAARIRETGARHLIWYQGCSDVHENECYTYESKLTQFLADFTNEFPNVKLFIIQISGTTKKESLRGWKMVRDAQRKAAEKFGAVLVPTYDLADYSDEIHLSGRANLRLAKRVYEAHRRNKCPGLVSAAVSGNEVRLTLSCSLETGAYPILLDENLKAINTKVIAAENVFLLRAKNSSKPCYATLDVGVYYGSCAEALPLPCADFLYDLNGLAESCK